MIRKISITMTKVFLLFLILQGFTSDVSAQCKPTWDRVKSSNCVNSPIYFKSNTTGRDSFSWDFGDGLTQGGKGPTNRDPVHSYTASGSYIVRLRANGVAGPCTDTLHIVIKVSPKIYSGIITPKAQCFEGNQFCFWDSTKAGKNSTIRLIQYLFSDGTLIERTDPKSGDINPNNGIDTFCVSIQDPNGGYFDLTIRAFDYNGCMTETKILKAIRVFPKLGIKFTSNKPVGCKRTMATIINTSDTFTKLSDIASFVWDFGDGQKEIGDSITNTKYWLGFKNDRKITHWYEKAGTFDGILTVTTKFGCTESFKFRGTAVNIILDIKIKTIDDSSCTSTPEVTVFPVTSEGLPFSGDVKRFLWNFGDPPDAANNMNDRTFAGATKSYGPGSWLISLSVESGPCRTIVFDTIKKIGPGSAIENSWSWFPQPYRGRILEDEVYQCIIRDSIHFPNWSTFYQTDQFRPHEDSIGCFNIIKYANSDSSKTAKYFIPPLTVDSLKLGSIDVLELPINRNIKFYDTPSDHDLFTTKDSIITKLGQVNLTKTISLANGGTLSIYKGCFIIFDAVDNPFASGAQTGISSKLRFSTSKQPLVQKGPTPSQPRDTARTKRNVIRLWDFGDRFAPQCTTDTKANRNVGLNCNFSMDSLPVHWYTPWDYLYQKYRSGQNYTQPIRQTKLCCNGKFLYTVNYYPARNVFIDSTIVLPYRMGVKKWGIDLPPGNTNFKKGNIRVIRVKDTLIGPINIKTLTSTQQKWTVTSSDGSQVKIFNTNAADTANRTTLVAAAGMTLEKNVALLLNDKQRAWSDSMSYTTAIGDTIVVLPKNKGFYRWGKTYLPGSGEVNTGTFRIQRIPDTIKGPAIYVPTLSHQNWKFVSNNGPKIMTKDIANGVGTSTIDTGRRKLKKDIQFYLNTKQVAISDTSYLLNTYSMTIQNSTYCIDTVIGGFATYVTRTKAFVDSAFHKKEWFQRNTQCYNVKLWHKDTIHPLKCESTSQKSLALMPPNSEGLKFKPKPDGPCFFNAAKKNALEFDLSETKPGCSQRLVKFNYDSATNKNNWIYHNALLTPPYNQPNPFVPPVPPTLWYPLAGNYGTTTVKPYQPGEIKNRNPGWVTIGLIIGNGRRVGTDAVSQTPIYECMDTTWYHNLFKIQYMNPQFAVVQPFGGKRSICVGDTITFMFRDPIQDSISEFSLGWNDGGGIEYYKEIFKYWQDYKGPSPTRNDKNVAFNKEKDKNWQYHYVIRTKGFERTTKVAPCVYRTEQIDTILDTLVTAIMTKYRVVLDVSAAKEELEKRFKQKGLDMNKISEIDLPCYFTDGSDNRIDTTGLGGDIKTGKIGWKSPLTVKRGSDVWEYTDNTKKDSVLIDRVLHFRDSTMIGYDKLTVTSGQFTEMLTKLGFFIAGKLRVDSFRKSYTYDSSIVGGLKYYTINGVYRHKYKHPGHLIVPRVDLKNRSLCTIFSSPDASAFNVGFFTKLFFSDTVVCHGTPITVRDSIRYFMDPPLSDPFSPFFPLDATKWWNDPVRYNKLRELKKLDFNEFDDTAKLYDRFGLGPFNFYYDEPGIYNVRVAIQDSMGCKDTISQKVWVTGVKAGFRSNLPPGGLSCKNILTFTDTSIVYDPLRTYLGPCPGNASIGDSIVNYEWTFGDGSQRSVLKNPSHYFVYGGTYNVRLKVRTMNGCEDSITLQVVVPGFKPYFNSITDTVVCEGDSVWFNNLSSDSISSPDWEWNWGDGQVSSQKARTKIGHAFKNAGVYEVYLNQSDVIRGTSIRCTKVYPDTSSEAGLAIIKRLVIVKPKAPADFSISDSIICPGENIIFESESDRLYTRFGWKYGDGQESFGPDTIVTHKYTTPGTYKVTLIPDYDLQPGEFRKCVKDTTKTIRVVDVSADFDINSADEPKYCFTNKSVGATKYRWVIEDVPANVLSTEENPCHDYADRIGCKKIMLIAENDEGCIDTAIKEVCNTFKSEFVPYNVFTPDGEDLLNNVFKVKIEGEEEYEIKIYSRWGELVFESTDKNNHWNGKVKNTGALCPHGVYYYVINYKLINKPKNGGKGPVSGTVTLIRK